MCMIHTFIDSKGRHLNSDATTYADISIITYCIAASKYFTYQHRFRNFLWNGFSSTVKQIQVPGKTIQYYSTLLWTRRVTLIPVVPICNSKKFIKVCASQRRYRMTFITQQTYLETTKPPSLYTKTHQSSADVAPFFLKLYKAQLRPRRTTFTSHWSSAAAQRGETDQFWKRTMIHSQQSHSHMGCNLNPNVVHASFMPCYTEQHVAEIRSAGGEYVWVYARLTMYVFVCLGAGFYYLLFSC